MFEARVCGHNSGAAITLLCIRCREGGLPEDLVERVEWAFEMGDQQDRQAARHAVQEWLHGTD